MNDAFYIGATALEAHQRAVDVLASNIANINSTGYKRSEVRFSELMVAPMQNDNATTATDQTAPVMNGSMGGVQVQTDGRVFDQGVLNVTGKAYDMAIDGDGFFELLGPSGQVMLWRGGTLKVNSDGYLAAANGYPLKQLIAVPDNANQLQISADGKVSALVGNATAFSEIGQIGLVHVRDTAALTSHGDGLYVANETSNLLSATPGQDGAGRIVQGSLEASNVSLTNEMTNLLLIQRVYAANAQVLQAADQLMGIANGLRRA